MKRKWKVVIASVICYQIALTLMLFKLTHYSQGLYFSDNKSFPTTWYEGDFTLPMREAKLWLGGILLILIVVNGIVFRRDRSN